MEILNEEIEKRKEKDYHLQLKLNKVSTVRDRNEKWSQFAD